MKKIFFLIISLIIITGCEATYTIDIDNDYSESTTLKPTSSTDMERFNKGTYKYPVYYDANFMEDEEEKPLDVIRYNYKYENSNVTYSYKFNGRYNDSNIANLATAHFNSTYSTDYRTTASIEARNFVKVFNNYPSLSKLTINVVTSKNVISSNADSVSGNVFTWYITNSNKNREIRIYFENDKYYSYIDDSNKDNNNNGNKNGGKVVPDNKDNKNSNNTSKKSTINIKNSTLLYVLYTLFFALIFVIIVFRKKFRR